MYRAYHALPPLLNAKGEPTGAVYGVIQMLRKLVKSYKPEYMAVVLDSKEPTFRHEIFPDYKANRPPMPEDLRSQWERLCEILPLMGIPLVKESGVEADDLMATWAVWAQKEGWEVLISSGDKDMTQLVCPHITVIDSMSQRTYDTAGVLKKFGVLPHQIADYLALMGDKIDHIPGVPGVGPKTAVKWLNTYGSLASLIDNAHQISGKIGEVLRAKLVDLPLSLTLVTLKTDIPVREKLSDFKLKVEKIQPLRKLLEELGFQSLLKEYVAVNEAAPALVCTFAQDDPNWRQRLATCLKAFFYFDHEKCVWCVIPMGAEPLHGFLIEPDRGDLLKVVRDFWADPTREILGHDLKNQWHQLTVTFPEMALAGQFEDTRLMSHTLQSQTSLDLKKISERLGVDEKNLAAIYLHLQNQLMAQPVLQKVYSEIEKPLIPILYRMEETGVLLDLEKLKIQAGELNQKIAALQEEVHRLTGISFNLDSPKQLREILFEREKLPVIEKTPKGEASTNERVLSALAPNYPVAALILSHRSLMKLKTTYVDKLPDCVHPQTGRLHARFDQSGTVTGRFSCSDPNLQNIPIRTEEGRRIRDAFIARPGWRMVACDYSQIELRIMAHLSGDPQLLSAFSAGEDIHRQTASEVFGVPMEAVSASERRAAKAINFGLIYGMSSFGLAAQLGVDRKAAQVYLNRYFERYPGVKQYMDSVESQAQEKGYVETLSGRRLYLPDIRSKDGFKRKAAIRAAVNAPMQGSAADIIKKAMIAVDQLLDPQKAVLLMQVHDELVFEIAAEQVDFYASQIRDAMIHAMPLKVPLEVSIGVGHHWGEAH